MSKTLPILFFLSFIDIGLGMASEYQIISEGGKKGVSDELGNIVIPIVYDDIGWSKGDFSIVTATTGYKENGKWGLINTKNEKITEPLYLDLYPIKSDVIVASRYNKYAKQLLFGILDRNGKAVVGFQYHSLIDHLGILLVSQEIENAIKWGVIDYVEQPIVTITYDSIRVYSDRFVAFRGDKSALLSITGEGMTEFLFNDIIKLGNHYLVYDEHGKVGLIDEKGNIKVASGHKSIELMGDSSLLVTEFPSWKLLTPANVEVKSFAYDKITPISHGVYKTTANAKEAIINIEGEYLVQGNDWRIEVPDDRFILVEVENKQGVIKEGGIEVLAVKYDSIYYSGEHFYSMILKDGRPNWRIYSTFGNPISSSVFQEVHMMSENLIATRKNGYWGYIDFSGHTTIEYKYDYAWPFYDGRAKVNYLGNQGIINQAGEWVIYPQHSEVTVVNEGLFINHTGERFDLIDNSEKVIYQTRHNLLPHSFGLLEKTNTGKYGLINRYGESIHYARYDSITELYGDQIYIMSREGQHGVIDKTGTFVLPMSDEYEQVGDLSEEFIIVKKSGRYGFIDLNGKLRIANRYDDVRPFANGMAAVKLLGRWGYIDKQERLKIQPQYDRVTKFRSGLSIVSRDGLNGLINMEGEEVLPLEYDSLYWAFDESLILVKDGQFGLANEHGVQLIAPKYDLLQELGNDQLIVKRRNRYGVIARNGIDIIPSIYEEILYDTYNNYYLAREPGIAKKIHLR